MSSDLLSESVAGQRKQDFTSTHSNPVPRKRALADYLNLLDSQGRALVDTVRQREAEDGIPFCEGWTLRDLVTRTAQVYRWATLIVGEARDVPPGGRTSASHWRTLIPRTRRARSSVSLKPTVPSSTPSVRLQRTWTAGPLWAVPPAHVVLDAAHAA